MTIRNVTPLRNKETLLASVLLIFGVVFFVAVARFPDTAMRYRAISPSFFPNLLAGAMVVLSVFLGVEGWRGAPARIFDIKAEPRDVVRAVLLVGILIAFLFLLKVLGFAITAFIFTGSVQLLLGEKRILRVALFSLTVTALLYIVFVTLLRVPLPYGAIFS